MLRYFQRTALDRRISRGDVPRILLWVIKTSLN